MKTNLAWFFMLFSLACGCATTPVDPAPANREPAEQVEKEAAPGRTAVPEHVEVGAILFVCIPTGSAEGTLLDKPHLWGRVVAKLKLNQRLTVLDWTTSGVFARARDEATKQEGWCRKRILSEAPVASRCVTPADFEESGARMAHASSLYPHQVNGPLTHEDPRFKQAIAEVDRLEQAVNQALGGSRNRPDGGLIRRALDEFARSGGLKR